MKTQVHKINRFIQFAILSFTLLFAASSFAGSGKYHKPKDIVTIAASVDSFTTLVAALQAAGLVDTLQGDGPFTVLAPTNDAFAELPEQTLQNLLEPTAGLYFARFLSKQELSPEIVVPGCPLELTRNTVL